MTTSKLYHNSKCLDMSFGSLSLRSAQCDSILFSLFSEEFFNSFLESGQLVKLQVHMLIRFEDYFNILFN